MIISFSVSNFGSIRDIQTLSFEADKTDYLENYYVVNNSGYRLLKLALIYGANASGKTSMLRALDFIRDLVIDPENKKNSSLKFEPFLFDNLHRNKTTQFSLEFLQKGKKYLYEIEFSKKFISKENLFIYDKRKSLVYKRVTNIENQFTKIDFGNKFIIDKSFKKTLEANTLWNNSVLGGFLKTNIKLAVLNDVLSWFFEYLKPIVLSKTDLESYITNKIDAKEIDKNDVVEILKKADFNISNIHIKEEKGGFDEKMIKVFEALNISEERIEKIKDASLMKLNFEHTVGNDKFTLPFNLESEGTQRYYSFAGLLVMLLKDGVAIPIDELESSLHPDLYNHFLLTFLINSNKSQIIATTHNREILNNRDIFRDDAIWFTNKSNDGCTGLYSLADLDSSVIRDTSNVFNAYKIGKLGGIPNLGDYYIQLSENEEKK